MSKYKPLISHQSKSIEFGKIVELRIAQRLMFQGCPETEESLFFRESSENNVKSPRQTDGRLR